VSLSTDGIDPARSPAAPQWSTQKSPQRRRRAKSLCYTPWSLRLKKLAWNPWDGTPSWYVHTTVPTHVLCEHTPNQP
jgi:hypothetical protein